MTLKYKYQCNNCGYEYDFIKKESIYLCPQCQKFMTFVEKVYYIDEVTIEKLLLEMPYVR